jgi:uncharacterized protein
LVESFFFDTYAIYELIEGNKQYEPYGSGLAIITTKLNLMELHYVLLVKYDKGVANYYYDEFERFAVDIDGPIIKAANEFRALMKGKRLSYVDCIGYILAKARNAKFLTGDKEFQGLENVQFIK